MVKGVNRQVLEILEPQCDYFEKALFFVKPEYSNESDAKLRNQALKSIQNSNSLPKSRKQKVKSKVFFIAQMLSSAVAGSIITALIIK
ncbi:MAG: hypothetical protein IKJ86_06970 [Clostridia bacterium]|nr:hypothetical protein [Clostridia bacterium]